ncbi:MAG: hypothetical protein UT34_C0002G0110 [candidate division WS6 bacterium GW2011_GWF2_39_15]|uniref:Fibronectin type-III domain-containing protein n=1 Tax=candidate division WS6 bacterium GW2011_GWF2_39_15 TaxID=1619100 RepID=A0A0G0MR56_9BACT|nr:MAG: hypothetical protein UT34_C0002G0110 [candidate division WS6 bacterium GW2011_GWF2_39_15]
MKKLLGDKNRKHFPLLAFIFILLSIPLAVYGLLNLDSFDIRNKAADTTTVYNQCKIAFPYVNPRSIEKGKVVQMQVDAITPDENIKSVSVMDRAGNIIFSKEYTTLPNTSISEIFTFTSQTTGDLNMLGTLTTDKETKPCVVEENRSVTVISTNLAPEFKTLPSAAKPSNVLKVKDSYEYLMRVEDKENDTINYAFSFTPNADWLKYSVIEDGGTGKLTIKFTGIPDKPASYLANIFVHDGYNKHLRSQSWVINVDQDKNDVPKVTVYEPSKDATVTQGGTIKVSWEGSDLNQIVKYELYLATNPANPNSWIAVNKNISHKVGSYIVDTTSFPSGTYQAVVRATDNYNPAATGVGVSAGKIVVKELVPVVPDPDEPDDGIILVDPQIINISPSKGSKLKNKNATVSATIIAGTRAEIDKGSIVFFIDDKDVTKDVKVNEISKSEYSLIYSTPEPYKEGTHKVNIRFKDSKGGTAQKDWTFEITAESTSDDTYNIFGFEIPKRTAMIVGGGILLLLLAILVPWVLYLLWRGSKDEEYETVYTNTYTPVKPSSTPEFEEEKEEVKEKPESKVDDDKKTETQSQSFTAPKPSANMDMWVPVVAPKDDLTVIKETQNDIVTTIPEDKEDVQTPPEEPILAEETVPTVVQPEEILTPTEKPLTTEETIPTVIQQEPEPEVVITPSSAVESPIVIQPNSTEPEIPQDTFVEEPSQSEENTGADDLMKLAEELSNAPDAEEETTQEKPQENTQTNNTSPAA